MAGVSDIVNGIFLQLPRDGHRVLGIKGKNLRSTNRAVLAIISARHASSMLGQFACRAGKSDSGGMHSKLRSGLACAIRRLTG